MANVLDCNIIITEKEETYSVSRKSLRGVVANVLDCNIIITEKEETYSVSRKSLRGVVANVLDCNIIITEKEETYSVSRKSLRDVVANVLDCNIIITEFELRSLYYVHFRTNTLAKGMDPFTLPTYGLNITTKVISLQGWL